MQGGFLRTAVGVGVAVALFLLGFLTAGLFYNPPHQSGDLATWMGALGTFLAFAGAIWVATSESRRRRDEEITKAQLYAASMELRIVHVRGTIAESCRALSAWKVGDGIDLLERILEAFKVIEIWSIEEVLPLTPLPNNVAVLLAQVADQLNAVKLLLEKGVRNSKQNPGVSIPMLVQGLHKNLGTTARYLETSAEECRRAITALHSKDQ